MKLTRYTGYAVRTAIYLANNDGHLARSPRSPAPTTSRRTT